MTWPPSRCVPFGNDAVNSIRRQKTILDTLTQTVGVDRVAEVSIGIAIFFPQRCRRHAQLKGRLEVTQDLAPIALILGAAAMTFVDDDQVEEVLGVFLIKSGTVLVFGDGLVDREVHLAPFIHFAVLNLPSSIAESSEHLVLGIVD